MELTQKKAPGMLMPAEIHRGGREKAQEDPSFPRPTRPDEKAFVKSEHLPEAGDT